MIDMSNDRERQHLAHKLVIALTESMPDVFSDPERHREMSSIIKRTLREINQLYVHEFSMADILVAALTPDGFKALGEKLNG